jgi:hypothetical protein
MPPTRAIVQVKAASDPITKLREETILLADASVWVWLLIAFATAA